MESRNIWTYTLKYRKLMRRQFRIYVFVGWDAKRINNLLYALVISFGFAHHTRYRLVSWPEWMLFWFLLLFLLLQNSNTIGKLELIQKSKVAYISTAFRVLWVVVFIAVDIRFVLKWHKNRRRESGKNGKQ